MGTNRRAMAAWVSWRPSVSPLQEPLSEISGAPSRAIKSPFILRIEGCLLMTSGVHVLDVSWQHEEEK